VNVKQQLILVLDGGPTGPRVYQISYILERYDIVIGLLLFLAQVSPS